MDKILIGRKEEYKRLDKCMRELTSWNRIKETYNHIHILFSMILMITPKKSPKKIWMANKLLMVELLL